MQRFYVPTWTLQASYYATDYSTSLYQPYIELLFLSRSRSIKRANDPTMILTVCKSLQITSTTTGASSSSQWYSAQPLLNCSAWAQLELSRSSRIQNSRESPRPNPMHLHQEWKRNLVVKILLLGWLAQAARQWPARTWKVHRNNLILVTYSQYSGLMIFVV